MIVDYKYYLEKSYLYVVVGFSGLLRVLLTFYSTYLGSEGNAAEILAIVNTGSLFALPINLTFGAKILYTDYFNRGLVEVFKQLNLITFLYVIIVYLIFDISWDIGGAIYSFSMLPLLTPILLKKSIKNIPFLFALSSPILFSLLHGPYLVIILTIFILSLLEMINIKISSYSLYIRNIGIYSLVAISTAVIPWIIAAYVQGSEELNTSQLLTLFTVLFNLLVLIPRKWSYTYLANSTLSYYFIFRRRVLRVFLPVVFTALIMTALSSNLFVVILYMSTSLICLPVSNRLLLSKRYNLLLSANLVLFFFTVFGVILKREYLEIYMGLSILSILKFTYLDRYVNKFQ